MRPLDSGLLRSPRGTVSPVVTTAAPEPVSDEVGSNSGGFFGPISDLADSVAGAVVYVGNTLYEHRGRIANVLALTATVA